MQTMTSVTIENFNLNVFKHLLDQSLAVDTQLMLEFSDTEIKACSFSGSKSFIKLWVIPLHKLIVAPQEELTGDLFEVQPSKETPLKFEAFNFLVLKGDSLRKYFDVYNNNDTADLSFNIGTFDGKLIATSMTINGKTVTGSTLKTSFELTTEEFLTNKITDYAPIIKELKPDSDMEEIVLNSKQIQEVRGLIKTLHKSVTGNTAFLAFEVSSEKISIKDKVFNIDFQITQEQLDQKLNVIGETQNFSILKTDFAMIGAHNFIINTKNESNKIIFIANYAGALISCMSSKITIDPSLDSDNMSEDLANLDEYGLTADDFADIPF